MNRLGRWNIYDNGNGEDFPSVEYLIGDVCFAVIGVRLRSREAYVYSLTADKDFACATQARAWVEASAQDWVMSGCDGYDGDGGGPYLGEPTEALWAAMDAASRRGT